MGRMTNVWTIIKEPYPQKWETLSYKGNKIKTYSK